MVLPEGDVCLEQTIQLYDLYRFIKTLQIGLPLFVLPALRPFASLNTLLGPNGIFIPKCLLLPSLLSWPSTWLLRFPSSRHLPAPHV